MTNVEPLYNDSDPDVVAYTMQMVIAMAPAFSASLARQIEERVKAEFGGRRLYLPKGAKRLTPDQQAQVFQDGLSKMSNDEIIDKHRISRSTLYRVMKNAGGRFSGP